MGVEVREVVGSWGSGGRGGVLYGPGRAGCVTQRIFVDIFGASRRLKLNCRCWEWRGCRRRSYGVEVFGGVVKGGGGL